MTDREKIKEMLDRAGIVYTEDDTHISIEAGYVGFVSIFLFNNDGSLKAIEAYE